MKKRLNLVSVFIFFFLTIFFLILKIDSSNKSDSVLLESQLISGKVAKVDINIPKSSSITINNNEFSFFLENFNYVENDKLIMLNDSLYKPVNSRVIYIFRNNTLIDSCWFH